MTKKQKSEILSLLKASKTILLFPHVQMDGDSFGSSLALCRALRKEGKIVYILLEENIPKNLAFLCGANCEDDCSEYCVEHIDLPEAPDFCLAIDCSDRGRLESRTELFFSGKKTGSIDHHVTHEVFADHTFVDKNAAATGEIIYQVLKEMGLSIDKMTAEALYVAIVTDTGNFQYSNTTKNTHLVITELYDCGIDHTEIAVKLYQNMRPEKVKLTGIALAGMEFFSEGKACITLITQEDLKRSGAFFNESEGIVEQLRNISGVEISIVLKEDKDKLKVKVGMRAKKQANVALISQVFGGGGHEKAAGCTIEGSIEEARIKIMEAAAKELARISGK